MLKKYQISVGVALVICPITAFLFLIGIIQPQPHQQTGNNSKHYSAEKIPPKSPDERIAIYTEVLAWFTGVLAVVSGVQGFFLYRAEKISRSATAELQKHTDDYKFGGRLIYTPNKRIGVTIPLTSHEG